MINELEQLQNFQDDLGSRDALDRLRALQHMQGRNQGLMGLPVVQEPVGDPRAMLQPPVDPRAIIQNIPQEIQQPTPTIRVPISAGGTLELDPNTIETMEGQQGSPFNPILGAAYGGPIRYREGGGPLANTAEGLASTIKPYRDEYIISRSNITKYEGEFKNIREQLGEIRKAKERLRDNINLSGSDKRVILEQLIKKELSISSGRVTRLCRALELPKRNPNKKMESKK